MGSITYLGLNSFILRTKDLSMFINPFLKWFYFYKMHKKERPEEIGLTDTLKHRLNQQSQFRLLPELCPIDIVVITHSGYNNVELISQIYQFQNRKHDTDVMIIAPRNVIHRLRGISMEQQAAKSFDWFFIEEGCRIRYGSFLLETLCATPDKRSFYRNQDRDKQLFSLCISMKDMRIMYSTPGLGIPRDSLTVDVTIVPFTNVRVHNKGYWERLEHRFRPKVMIPYILDVRMNEELRSSIKDRQSGKKIRPMRIGETWPASVHGKNSASRRI